MGAPPATGGRVRKALATDPLHQTWSALRRNTMEMRAAGRPVRGAAATGKLISKTRRLVPQGRLRLRPDLPTPEYLTAVDHHCMPGSYYAEHKHRDDVSGAANYDSGMFVTTGGLLGRYTDGGGRGVVEYLQRHYPHWQPRRILDLGCGLGHNVLPMAAAFPRRGDHRH